VKKRLMKSSKRTNPSIPVARVAKHAASANQQYPSIANDIIHEVYLCLELLRADEQLLSFIGSWNETLSDEDVLAGLRFWIKLKRKERRRNASTSSSKP